MNYNEEFLVIARTNFLEVEGHYGSDVECVILWDKMYLSNHIKGNQMIRLINACNKIQELTSIKGKNDKQAYIIKHKNDEDFLKLILYRLDIFKTYKISKLPVMSYQITPTLTFDEFIALLDELNTSNINDKLRQQANIKIHQADYKIGDVLIGIVTKSLNLGIDTGINKALGFEFIPSFDVMLADSLKEKHSFAKPHIVEKKIDGVRCTALVKGDTCKLYTRQGRQLDFPQISTEFVEFANDEDMMFDMELDMTSRTGISGVCNSNLKTGYAVNSDSNIVAYVFDEMPLDIFLTKGKTKPQKTRTDDLHKRHFRFTKAKRIVLCESQVASSYDKIMEISNDYITRGFEGTIVKDMDAPYAFKRNKAWLKVKAVNSCTLEIISTTEGEGKRAGKVGALTCASSCGNVIVNVGSGLTDDDIDTFSNTSPVGKFIEVLFNALIKGEDSDVYSLFLPRYKELRIDVEEADSLDKIKEQHIGAIL